MNKRRKRATVILLAAGLLAGANMGCFAAGRTTSVEGNAKLNSNSEKHVKVNAGSDYLKVAIDTVELMAQKAIDDKTVVGMAVAVVKDDKVVYSKGFGLREAGKDAKLRRYCFFNLRRFQTD
ncbi:hypothetical protein KF913_23430 [Candidatus Obscuribacterales bacterium]|nr:hypothetical protein [Candidatus Obscuribacterales bacterium]